MNVYDVLVINISSIKLLNLNLYLKLSVKRFMRTEKIFNTFYMIIVIYLSEMFIRRNIILFKSKMY